MTAMLTTDTDKSTPTYGGFRLALFDVDREPLQNGVQNTAGFPASTMAPSKRRILVLPREPHSTSVERSSTFERTAVQAVECVLWLPARISGTAPTGRPESSITETWRKKTANSWQ